MATDRKLRPVEQPLWRIDRGERCPIDKCVLRSGHNGDHKAINGFAWTRAEPTAANTLAPDSDPQYSPAPTEGEGAGVTPTTDNEGDSPQ